MPFSFHITGMPLYGMTSQPLPAHQNPPHSHHIPGHIPAHLPAHSLQLLHRDAHARLLAAAAAGLPLMGAGIPPMMSSPSHDVIMKQYNRRITEKLTQITEKKTDAVKKPRFDFSRLAEAATQDKDKKEPLSGSMTSSDAQVYSHSYPPLSALR